MVVLAVELLNALTSPPQPTHTYQHCSYGTGAAVCDVDSTTTDRLSTTTSSPFGAVVLIVTPGPLQTGNRDDPIAWKWAAAGASDDGDDTDPRDEKLISRPFLNGRGITHGVVGGVEVLLVAASEGLEEVIVGSRSAEGLVTIDLRDPDVDEGDAELSLVTTIGSPADSWLHLIDDASSPPVDVPKLSAKLRMKGRRRRPQSLESAKGFPTAPPPLVPVFTLPTPNTPVVLREIETVFVVADVIVLQLLLPGVGNSL